MTAQRSRVWWIVALCFTLANLAALVLAAVQDQQVHTDIHMALLFVGGYFVWRLAPRRVAR